MLTLVNVCGLRQGHTLKIEAENKYFLQGGYTRGSSHGLQLVPKVQLSLKTTETENNRLCVCLFFYFSCCQGKLAFACLKYKQPLEGVCGKLYRVVQKQVGKPYQSDSCILQQIHITDWIITFFLLFIDLFFVYFFLLLYRY